MYFKVFICFFVCFYSSVLGVDYIATQDHHRCRVFNQPRDENQALSYTRNIDNKLTDHAQIDYSRTATLMERQIIYKAMMGSVIVHDLSHNHYDRDNRASDPNYMYHFEALEIIDLYIQMLWKGIKEYRYFDNINQICSNSYHKKLLTQHFLTWFYEALDAYRGDLNNPRQIPTTERSQKAAADAAQSPLSMTGIRQSLRDSREQLQRASEKYKEDHELFMQRSREFDHKLNSLKIDELFKPIELPKRESPLSAQILLSKWRDYTSTRRADNPSMASTRVPDLAYLKLHSLNENVLQIDLSPLAKLKNLIALEIYWVGITGFSSLALPRLRTMSVYTSDLSPIVPYLMNFTALQTINLGQIQDKSVENAGQAKQQFIGKYSHLTSLCQLRTLNLFFGRSFESTGYKTHEDLNPFPSILLLTQLDHLTINSTYVTREPKFPNLMFITSLAFNTCYDKGIPVIPVYGNINNLLCLTQLRSLDLFSPNLTHVDIALIKHNYELLSHLTNLTHLTIGTDVCRGNNPTEPPSKALSGIRTLPNLTSLRIKCSSILPILNEMTGLKKLGLFNIVLPADRDSFDLKMISNLTNLEKLELALESTTSIALVPGMMTTRNILEDLGIFLNLQELHLYLKLYSGFQLPMKYLPPKLNLLNLQSLNNTSASDFEMTFETDKEQRKIVRTGNLKIRLTKDFSDFIFF